MHRTGDGIRWGFGFCSDARTSRRTCVKIPCAFGVDYFWLGDFAPLRERPIFFARASPPGTSFGRRPQAKKAHPRCRPFGVPCHRYWNTMTTPAGGRPLRVAFSWLLLLAKRSKRSDSPPPHKRGRNTPTQKQRHRTRREEPRHRIPTSAEIRVTGNALGTAISSLLPHRCRREKTG